MTHRVRQNQRNRHIPESIDQTVIRFRDGLFGRQLAVDDRHALTR